MVTIHEKRSRQGIIDPSPAAILPMVEGSRVESMISRFCRPSKSAASIEKIN